MIRGADMAGKSPAKASDDQRAALEVLAVSRNRGEADRAARHLLTLDGASARIAEVFRVREGYVRLWRGDFARGGVEAIKASVYAGPPPVKTEAALRVCAPLLESARGEPCKLDGPAPHRRDQKARTRRYRAIATLQGAAKKKLPVAAATAHAEGAANRG